MLQKTRPSDPSIIFCDIDGVLLLPENKGMTATARHGLRLLVDDGFELVVHSTLRATMPDFVLKLFGDAGFRVHSSCDASIVSKRNAIVDYLRNRYGDQSDWPRCVVIDDHPITPVEGLQILRIGRRGFTVQDAEKILNMEVSIPEIPMTQFQTEMLNLLVDDGDLVHPSTVREKNTCRQLMEMGYAAVEIMKGRGSFGKDAHYYRATDLGKKAHLKLQESS